MNKILFSLIIFFFSAQKSMAQQFTLEQKSFSFASQIESKLGSKQVNLGGNVILSPTLFPAATDFNLAGPIVFKRKTANDIPLIVEYYYSKPDSVIRFVLYDWQKGGTNPSSLLKESIKEKSKPKPEDYVKIYESVQKEMINEVGQPDKTIDESSEGSIKRLSIWETNDLHAKLWISYGNITFMVRMVTYWDK